MTGSFRRRIAAATGLQAEFLLLGVELRGDGLGQSSGQWSAMFAAAAGAQARPAAMMAVGADPAGTHGARLPEGAIDHEITSPVKS